MECEAHFTRNVTRNPNGRYVVALPFKPNFKLSRGSKQIALNSLHQLHKEFEKNSNYKIQYIAIIREYLDLNHMSLLESTIQNDEFYLPHHKVFKNSSSTTKFRVVFNPSIADKESLNSQLIVGATIQDDLMEPIVIIVPNLIDCNVTTECDKNENICQIFEKVDNAKAVVDLMYNEVHETD